MQHIRRRGDGRQDDDPLHLRHRRRDLEHGRRAHVVEEFNAQSETAVVELDPLPAGTDYATALKTTRRHRQLAGRHRHARHRHVHQRGQARADSRIGDRTAQRRGLRPGCRRRRLHRAALRAQRRDRPEHHLRQGLLRGERPRSARDLRRVHRPARRHQGERRRAAGHRRRRGLAERPALEAARRSGLRPVRRRRRILERRRGRRGIRRRPSRTARATQADHR